MSELNFLHSNGNKVKLTTPDTLAANKTFKLPGSDGSSGQFLKTDGSGALSFDSIAVGKVLQCKVSYDSTMVTVNNTTSGQSSQYGLTGYRVYGDLNTITITPVSATSTMIIQGLSGGTNSNVVFPVQGAYGVVAILNNSSTGAIDNTDYQYYPLANGLHTGLYLPNTEVQGHYAAGNTNAQTWRLKGYAYTEGSNHARIRFIKHHLIIWEVEI
tara:strand:+ start:547 stop:1188 length:642 start_codon:yes stop_codon:yes gene_type:complete